MPINIRKTAKRLLPALLTLACSQQAWSLPTSFYAASSQLSSGNWVKIRVDQAGMQFISNSELKKMGFSDPSKVKVYGYGGRALSENLNSTMPDDLPQQPSISNDKGLMFFGTDHFTWSCDRTTDPTTRLEMAFTHTINPYAETSYYFLSDREAAPVTIEERDATPNSGSSQVTTFRERRVHEKDLYHISNVGRLMLGEDMRSPTSRSFTFDLPEIGTGQLRVRLAALATTTSGTARFALKSRSGSSASSNTPISMSGSADKLGLKPASALFAFKETGEKVQLDVTLTSTGTTTLAGIDYIELEYDRPLAMNGGNLYFYIRPSRSSNAVLSGVTSNTQVWDVTDPARPVKMQIEINGSTARFALPLRYSEFVAFDSTGSTPLTPVKVSDIANQDIHSMEIPDMVIITPPEYMTAAERVANIHRTDDGMKVHVLTPEVVYNEFASGNPDVTAFRKLLKMWYDRSPEMTARKQGPYCLIMSRPSYDNKMVNPTVKAAGYPRIPIYHIPTPENWNSSFSADSYIGMLDDCDNFVIKNSFVRAGIGRFAVRSLQEANAAVDKLEKYLKPETLGPWLNDVLLLADDGNLRQHMSQTDLMRSRAMTGRGANYQFRRLYLDSYNEVQTSLGLEYPEAKEELIASLNRGIGILTYIGHANTVSWTHEHVMEWTDFLAWNNPRLPFLYAATCEFNRWDADEQSGAEMLWLKKDSGIIATICPSRSVLIGANANISSAFGYSMSLRDENGLTPRLGDLMMNTLNINDPSIWKGGIDASTSKETNPLFSDITNRFAFSLLGDPAMHLPGGSYNVKIETLGGEDLTLDREPADYPVMKAAQKVTVTGCVTDKDGVVMDSFNGKIDITMQDAEVACQTLGNPIPKGEENNENVIEMAPHPFNERTTRLANFQTNVENGRWEAEFVIPTEILDNFSPARLAAYAWTESGLSANGSTEKFYVYGFDETTEADIQGPEITMMALNHRGFVDGGVVNETPVFIAEFNDPSGINLSDLGIGRQLNLLVDDQLYYGLGSNFTPDPEQFGAGTLRYQLPEQQPGDHTLVLTVWDNAGNFTKQSLSFTVAANKAPEIMDLTTDCNPASTAVVFSIGTDRPLSSLGSEIEVFDISGRKVWSDSQSATDADSNVSVRWDLTDGSGARVPRGIYLYRATLRTADGKTVSKTKKLAVTAQ